MRPGLDGSSPAGFWRRSLAYAIDWLLLAPILIVLLAPVLTDAWAAMRGLNSLLQEWLLAKILASPEPLPSPISLAQAVLGDAPLLKAINATFAQVSWALSKAVLLGAGTAAIYFVGFEASAWRATPGKGLLGISVLDLLGQRISWRRAGARFLSGTLSWLSLNLGHAVAAWRTDGRALHDLIAGTCVVVRTPMPRWGRWLLYALPVLLCALLVGLLARLLWLLAQVENTSGF